MGVIQKLTWFGIGSIAMASLAITGVHAATLTVAQDGSGDYATIQEAIDAAAEGDIVEIAAGTYEEDISVGDLNAPPTMKNNLTVRAAEGADVEIILQNEANRVGSLPLDFGGADVDGFFINGDGVVIEGLRIVQPTTVTNELAEAPHAAAMSIVSPNVTIRDCEIIGSETFDGDIIGILIANLDIAAAQAGSPNLAQNITIEDCHFEGNNFALATNNFLAALGVPVPDPSASIIDTRFFNNGTGVEMDDGTMVVDGCDFFNNGTGISVSEHEITITDTIIMNSTGYGIESETGDIDEDSPQDVPSVTLNEVAVFNNGSEDDDAGMGIESGQFNTSNSIFAGNTPVNVFLNPDGPRDLVANFDQCDFYRSTGGFGIRTAGDPTGVIDIIIRNSNIVDDNGIDNQAGVIALVQVEYSNLFVSGEQFGGDPAAFETSNILNVDPLYVNPVIDDIEAADFSLQPDSSVAEAGADGTFIGSMGVSTSVENWMLN